MFDTEKFIGEIEKRPAIFDVKDKEYPNRDLKIKLWDEVGENMFNKWYDFTEEDKNKLRKELQTKWKSIRDHFRKELLLEKKVKDGKAPVGKKRYIYYEQLQFLKEYFKKNPCPLSSSNEKEDETSQPETEVISNVDIGVATVSDNLSIRTEKREQSRAKRKYQENSDIDEIRNILLERQQQNEDKMGNKAFLMSLLPLLDKMSQDDVIHFRFKIMEMFHQYNITHSVELNSQINLQSICNGVASNSNLSPHPDSPKLNPIRTPSPATSEDSQISEASSILDLY